MHMCRTATAEVYKSQVEFRQTSVIISATYVYCLFIPIANAAVLLLMALLVFYNKGDRKVLNTFLPVDFLYIIVGVELVFALPCLIYYIGM